jgi:hypothetical protein
MRNSAAVSEEPNDDQAFVRAEDDVESLPPQTFKKVRIPVTDEGIDWEKVPESQKAAVIAKIAEDAEVLTHIAGSATEEGGEAAEPTYLKQVHANTFLEGLAWVERKFLPPQIAKIIKRPLHPAVVDTAFNFSDEQKAAIAPSLLRFAEEVIPEKYKKIIAYGTDRYEFIGLIAWAIKEQCQTAVKLQLEYEKNHPYTPPEERPDQTPPEDKGQVM